MRQSLLFLWPKSNVPESSFWTKFVFRQRSDWLDWFVNLLFKCRLSTNITLQRGMKKSNKDRGAKETEKEMNDRLEREFYSEIPHDSQALLQWKKEIADALNVPVSKITTPILRQLKKILLELRPRDLYQFRRSPRRVWFLLYQIARNYDAIRRYAPTILEKFNLSPNEESIFGDSLDLDNFLSGYEQE